MILIKTDIFDYVSVETLYSWILKENIIGKKKYRSPLRTDNTPSFTIKNGWWTDWGTGEYGNIFDLIKKCNNIKTDDQLVQFLNDEFNDIISKVHVNEAKISDIKYSGLPEMEIRIKSMDYTARDIIYWNQYEISINDLTKYNVKPVYCYWLYKNQEQAIYPSNNCYAYEPAPGKYVIYQPLVKKEYKFRNNLGKDDYYKIKGGNTAIITKSYKDCMVLNKMGYSTYAPKSENIMLPNAALIYMKYYSKKFILFDNDGKENSSKYPEELQRIFIPLDSQCKDISDFVAKYGFDKGKELIKKLTNE